MGEEGSIVKKLDLSPMLSPRTEDDKSIGSHQTTPLSSRKASKMSAVIGDGSFEAVMKERAKQRKEKDDQTIAELRVCMTNMERSLNQEIKRRIECTTSLETKCTEQISAMEERLNSIIDAQADTIKGQLSLVEKRVDELNARLEEERTKIPLDIEQRGKELQQMLNSFQENFNLEKTDRLNREGRIMKQLTDHAVFMGKQWNEESTSREDNISELTLKLQEHSNTREEADSKFEHLIETELKTLKQDIERERNERKLEDDEIVEALNRYTDNLQNSLAVLSSVGN